MSWDFLLHPASAYAFTGAGLLACGYLFLSVKREILASSRRCGDVQKALKTQVRNLEETVKSLTRRLDELGDLPEFAAPAPPAGSLNISKRTQALRMHRRGEPADRIASSLSLPQQEVELLLKVESLAAEKA